MLLDKNQIEELITLLKYAGEQTIQYYNMNDIEVEYKHDKSPVTIADKKISELIINTLKKLTPNTPIISEEENYQENISILKKFSTYWLVDPIDGTKSFIRKSGDFTLNIGLISDEEPIFGMIYHPIKKTLYFTGADQKSYKEQEGNISLIQVNPNTKGNNSLSVVLPSKKLSDEMELFISMLDIAKIHQVSSSYKFCLLAEGKYDIYPNFNRINTWDIAAGHAILLKSGGEIYNINGKKLRYSKGSLRSEYFIAFNKNLEETVRYILSNTKL